jgi:hypothetical protein
MYSVTKTRKTVVILGMIYFTAMEQTPIHALQARKLLVLNRLAALLRALLESHLVEQNLRLLTPAAATLTSQEMPMLCVSTAIPVVRHIRMANCFVQSLELVATPLP